MLAGASRPASLSPSTPVRRMRAAWSLAAAIMASPQLSNRGTTQEPIRGTTQEPMPSYIDRTVRSRYIPQAYSPTSPTIGSEPLSRPFSAQYLSEEPEPMVATEQSSITINTEEDS